MAGCRASQEDRRAEGPAPVRAARNGDRRVHDMAFEPVSRGRILTPRTAGVGGVPGVHIDIGVLVHGIAIPMCAPPIPHVAGGVAVAPRPQDRRCRSRGCGRGGSDPKGRGGGVKTHLRPSPHQALGLRGRSHPRPCCPVRHRRPGGSARNSKRPHGIAESGGYRVTTGRYGPSWNVNGKVLPGLGREKGEGFWEEA